MKLIFLILTLLLPYLPISGEDQFTSLSLQAEALVEAHDYAAANQMYAKLLDLSPSAWQKGRLLYNLGSIQLAQQKPIDALALFKKINPLDLSLLRFGSHLYLNEGIAYLQYAQSLALDSTSSLDQQTIFITQSLHTFDQAQQLECQAQKEENSAACIASDLLNQWIETARLQLNQVFQNKRQNWLKNADVELIASLIYKNMQEWIDQFKRNPTPSKSFFLYFQHQAEALIPLWKALQEKEFSKDQKVTFENSIASYQNAMQNLNDQNRSSTLKEWDQSIEAIHPLAFQKNQDIQYARLNYDLLLMRENLTTASLQALIKQFENLKVEKEHAFSLEQIQTFLKESLKALEGQQTEQALFFFIAGYSQLSSLFKAKASSPAEILQHALSQCKQTLNLSFLAEVMPQDKIDQVHAILKHQQGNMLTHVKPFIPTVLKEEDERFHQTQQADSRCQQIPWDQVIPLYDRGFRFAQSIDQRFQQGKLDFSVLIMAQIQVIKEWEQALNLILHPPQQGGGGAAEQKWADTFRQLQEMYLEDQAKPDQTPKELHSW